MKPWYKGFKGTILLEADNKYISTGVCSRINNTTIEITELPVGKWTQTYKEFLESLVESNEIINYVNNCDDVNINFKVIMQKTVIDELMNKNEVIKKLKLTTSINTSNMHVFDEDCKIRKISCPEEIIYRFYKIRKNHFIKRKKYLIDKLESEYSILESKIKFINYVISEKIIVFNRQRIDINKQIELVDNKLTKIDNSWDYLLDLKMWSLTQEKIKEMEDRMKKMNKELESLRKTSVSEMWTSELLLI
jgi:DNA topoisomerase-2